MLVTFIRQVSSPSLTVTIWPTQCLTLMNLPNSCQEHVNERWEQWWCIMHMHCSKKYKNLFIYLILLLQWVLMVLVHTREAMCVLLVCVLLRCARWICARVCIQDRCVFMNRKNYRCGFIGQGAVGKTNTQGPRTPTQPSHFSSVLKDVRVMVTDGRGGGGGERERDVITPWEWHKKWVIISAVIMKYSLERRWWGMGRRETRAASGGRGGGSKRAEIKRGSEDGKTG